MNEKEMIEITEKAVRKNKEVSMADLLNQEQTKLQKAMIEEIISYLRECSNNAWAKGFDYAEIDNEKLRKFLALFPECSVVLTKEKYINGSKSYSNATLKSWKKKDLIEHIRILEHNWASAEKCIDNQAKNYEMLLNQTRKETAKEILQTIWEEVGIDILSQCYTIPVRTFNKLKRQFSVEVEE